MRANCRKPTMAFSLVSGLQQLVIGVENSHIDTNLAIADNLPLYVFFFFQFRQKKEKNKGKNRIECYLSTQVYLRARKVYDGSITKVSKSHVRSHHYKAK